MKLIILAFILSLIFHLLFLLKFKTAQEQFFDKPSSTKKIDKSSVHFVKLQSKAVPKIEKKQESKKELKKTKEFKKASIPKKEIIKRPVIKKQGKERKQRK